VNGLIDDLSMDFSSIDAVCLGKKKGHIRYNKW